MTASLQSSSSKSGILDRSLLKPSCAGHSWKTYTKLSSPCFRKDPLNSVFPPAIINTQVGGNLSFGGSWLGRVGRLSALSRISSTDWSETRTDAGLAAGRHQRTKPYRPSASGSSLPPVRRPLRRRPSPGRRARRRGHHPRSVSSRRQANPPRGRVLSPASGTHSRASY